MSPSRSKPLVARGARWSEKGGRAPPGFLLVAVGRRSWCLEREQRCPCRVRLCVAWRGRHTARWGQELRWDPAEAEKQTLKKALRTEQESTTPGGEAVRGDSRGRSRPGNPRDTCRRGPGSGRRLGFPSVLTGLRPLPKQSHPVSAAPALSC